MSTPDFHLDNLLSTYKQYKADTEAIAGWLAETALKCGGQVSSSRLKGKARKQAKEMALKASTDPKAKPPQPHKYTIKCVDFVSMAKAIARFDEPKVQVPMALFNRLKRAISARQNTNEWFERTSQFTKSESNDRHRYFVGILKSTYEILHASSEERKAQERAAAGQTQAAPESESPLPGLSNRFEGLHVEDLDHVPDDEGSGPSGADAENSYSLPDVGGVTVVRDQGEVEAEFSFAILSFCFEIHHVRNFIRNIWLSYFQGVMEAMQASVLTNTAIQLIRELEQQLATIVERPRRYPEDQFPTWTFPAIINWQSHKLEYNCSLDDYVKPSEHIFRTECQHGDVFFFDTFFALKAAIYHYSSQPPRSSIPDYSTVYADISETQRRILKMLPLLQAAAFVLPMRNHDEITRGVGTMFETLSIPIWAVFCVQILLDIEDQQKHAKHVLKNGVNKTPLAELKKNLRERIQEFREFHLDDLPLGGVRVPAVTKNFEGAAKALRDLEDEVLRDGISQVLNEPFRERTNVFGPNPYLRINPVRCGMLKFDLFVQLHRRALYLESCWFGLTTMVHLYVACRQIFPDEPVWPDMEHALGLLDLDHIFFGGIPRSMEEAEKKFFLALGIVPSTVARNTRSRAGRFDMKRVRSVSNQSTLVKCFEAWSDGSLDDESMNDWLQNMRRNLHDPASLKHAGQQANLPKEARDILAVYWPRQPKTPFEVMSMLGVYTHYESADFQFDWYAFQKTVGQMWRKLAECIQVVELALEKPIYIVITILRQASDVERLALETKQDVPALIKSSRTHLAKAWDVIKSTFMTELDGVPHPSGDADMRVHVGDRQLMRMLRRHCGECLYPNTTVGMRQWWLYLNWPEEACQSATWAYIYSSNIQRKAMGDAGMPLGDKPGEWHSLNPVDRDPKAAPDNFGLEDAADLMKSLWSGD